MFYTRLMLEGVLVPVDHLAFTSTAHTDVDITRAVEAASAARGLQDRVGYSGQLVPEGG